MKIIVIAPTPFKECFITAREVAIQIAKGIRKITPIAEIQ